jgi:hypothetical protein
MILIAFASARRLGSEALTTNDIRSAGEHPVLAVYPRLGIDSGPTRHDTDITANDTWYPSGNPQLIDNTIDVDNNATLTIMPGCIVEFGAGAELQCGYDGYGAIVAVGKSDSTILFTTDAPVPSEGDWQDVGVYQYALPTTQFTYCTFQYGGQTASGYGEIFVRDNNVAKIDHCKVWKSGDYGIVFNSSLSGLASFTNNTITSCTLYPISIYPPDVASIGVGNVLTGNASGYDGVQVQAGTGTDGVTTNATWANLGVPYIIAGNIEVDAPTGPVLTIAPGDTVKFLTGIEFYCGYSNPGAIVADSVVFTSALATPSPGDWADIGFYDYTSPEASLTYCKLEYGGNSSGDIFIQNTINPTIAHDSIDRSANWGIYLNGTPLPDSEQLLLLNAFYLDDSGPINLFGSGIASRSPGAVVRKENLATVWGSAVQIPANLAGARARYFLLDGSGRKVLEMHAGLNDVSRIAPGVYFVREVPSAVGREPPAVYKVILTK